VNVRGCFGMAPRSIPLGQLYDSAKMAPGDRHDHTAEADVHVATCGAMVDDGVFVGVVFSPMLWLKLVPRTLRGMPRQWNNTRPPLPIAWRGGQIVPVPDWVKRIDEQPMPY
jgi:hypothetical protein